MPKIISNFYNSTAEKKGFEYRFVLYMHTKIIFTKHIFEVCKEVINHTILFVYLYSFTFELIIFRVLFVWTWCEWTAASSNEMNSFLAREVKAMFMFITKSYYWIMNILLNLIKNLNRIHKNKIIFLVLFWSCAMFYWMLNVSYKTFKMYWKEHQSLLFSVCCYHS
jgi:hypothetical protein